MARILVVDDSRTLRKVVTTTLERHGYEADAASDGLDALEKLRGPTGPYDLVLLDFVMPRMNGYQFCRALRDDAELCAQPVVLMSAKSDKIRDTFVQQTGALDALSKPFDARALVVVVENALRRVERGAQSAARLELAEHEPTSVIPPANLEDTRAKIALQVSEQIEIALAGGGSKNIEVTTANVRTLAGSLGELLTPEILQKLAGVLSTIETGAPPPLLAGDLSTVAIGAVLQLIQMERLTGVLTITRGDPPKPSDAPVEVTVTLRTGLVDLAQSRAFGVTSDEFRLGRHFIEAGLVTPKEIETLVRGEELEPPSSAAPLTVGPAQMAAGMSTTDAVPTVKHPEPPASSAGPSSAALDSNTELTSPLLGHALVRAQRISNEQLKVALTRQSSELLYEVLRWPVGRFDFRRAPPSPSARRAKLGLSVPSLVMEGFRRVDEWRLLERKLGGFDDVLVRDPVAISALGGTVDSTIEKTERAVLDAIDGDRTIREVVAASHLSSFDACRVLVQLIEARLVRRKS